LLAKVLLLAAMNPWGFGQKLPPSCQSLSGAGSRISLFMDEASLRGGDILTQEWVNGRGEGVRLLY